MTIVSPHPETPASDRRADRLGAWVLPVVVATTLLALAYLMATVGQALLHHRLLHNPLAVPLKQLADSHRRYRVALASFFVMLAASAILTIVWLYRVHRSLPRYGLKQSLSSWWAGGGWVVPFANLVVPAIVVADVGKLAARRRPAGVTWLVVLWWCSWLMAQVALSAANAMPQSLDGLYHSDLIRVIGAAALVVSGSSFAFVVRAVVSGTAASTGDGLSATADRQPTISA